VLHLARHEPGTLLHSPLGKQVTLTAPEKPSEQVVWQVLPLKVPWHSEGQGRLLEGTAGGG